MSYRTADNTRLVSIGLWDTNDLDKQISINKSAELHDHPGTWYLVLTAHHQGRYIDDPLFPGHENSTYDYVIKVTVPKLTEENIQLSNGSQTLNTKGFLVSSRIYNVKSDSFDEVNGEGVGGRLPEVAPTLGVFCVTRGMEMGYSLASNAEVVAIRVYDSSFGELPVSSELGNVVPAITGLPAGEYYVVLEIVYTGLYYKSHDATETVRIDEAFKLIVVDEIMSDSLNFPVHEWTESTADGKTTFKCTGCDKSITIASEIPNFSYAKVLEYHRIGDPGVKHEDFPYQYVNEISSVILAITCAERQVTIEYDTISVAFDKDASIWCVAFYNADLDGGDQSVYLDSMGLTRYIVYGE